MRVFFDASVLIAALLSSHGGSAFLFKLIKTGYIVGITSQTAIEEVLEKDKPQKLKKSKAEIEHFITESGLMVREAITSKDIKQYKNRVDSEDAHLIAGAILTRCTHLVSLDKKHLVRPDIQKEFLPLKIVSPKQLLEEIV